MCGLLRAKGFPWISPAGHILVLVLGLTVSLFQHSRDRAQSAAKMAPDLKWTLFSTKACVSINELLRK